MRCSACGQENRPGATFCAGCGGRLGPAPSEPFSVDGPAESAAPPAPTGIPTIRLERPGAEDQPAAERAPGQPLAVGDLIGGRFEVAAVVEETPERIVYRARDWARCAACGYDDNVKGDRFCLDCGASLEAALWASVTEMVRPRPAKADLTLSEGDRDYYVTLEAAAAAEPAPPAPLAEATRLAHRWGRASDPGLERERNEDYAECWTFSRSGGPSLGLFVVADGLGGADSGEVASQLATLTTWRVLHDRVWEPAVSGEVPAEEEVRAALAGAVQEANRAVYEARSEANSEMSTTITLALVIDGRAHIANVGDSRTYLYAAGGLRAVTKDHSLVQRLVDTGQITPAQVYTHPQRNLIYQSIGDRADVQVDLYDLDLHADDRLVLCSDGLWEMVRDEGIEEALLAEPDPQRACDRLVRHANLAGGEDNISVIIVQAVAA
jgi:serine/threonine protein phosphatase PrpC